MALLDRVKFDGPPDVLVWKWPSESLALGAQLIVNESQEALFFKSGQALDLFGPGTHTLASGNLPFLQKLVNLPFGGKTPFAAEVYYISKSVALAQDWGTRTPFMVLDPKYKVSIPLRAYGQYALRVVNSREFVTQIAGASGSGTRGTIAADAASKAFTTQVAPVVQGDRANAVSTNANDIARNLLESLIIACTQQSIGSHLADQKASVLELPGRVLDIAVEIQRVLKANFQTFGIELINFTLESANFDPKDESVQRLRTMLDEAARLDVVSEAFRRNQDFYRADRQFDVLQAAAEGGGPAGALMGAAMGVGFGLSTAGPAAVLARESIAKEPPSKTAVTICTKCGGQLDDSSKFCSTCGEPIGSQALQHCTTCGAANPERSKFCSQCGAASGARRCAKCQTELLASSRFCSQCGEKA